MKNPKETFVIAQFTDCHLFADKQLQHYGANVWDNLNSVLADITARTNINCAVFTGDLTQDHTEESYQHFVQAIKQANFKVPVYFLAGNHDDRLLLNKYLTKPTFQTAKTINLDSWQIQLLDSKSDTPSGLVTKQSLEMLLQNINNDKFQLVMMHHHPINVGYYIDKHGLLAQKVFWESIGKINERSQSIKAIACGHVHRAVHLFKNQVDVFTCPATSVQFGETKEDIGSILPSYRLFYLKNNGEIRSEVITL